VSHPKTPNRQFFKITNNGKSTMTSTGQRGFTCHISEGTCTGEVTVWVNAEDIEMDGNSVVERAAWREWRRCFGPLIGMAYTSCEIGDEIDE
jgi:isopenicillin N synthase-like dioxygenase